MNRPLEFAEYELRRYTAAMNISPKITFEVNPERFDKAAFFRFDAALDDAFTISVHNGTGTICATNSRAILLGVYRFLTLQGCRFLRPGKDGEYIPVLDDLRDVEATFYAHTRHRGISDYCCTGGIENMLDIIDWLPKIMMNSYFTEMTDCFWNMKFAYRARTNPYKKTMDVSRELFNTWMERMNGAIAQRGILRHSAGHGWTIRVMEGVGELKNKFQLRELGENPVCTNPEVLPLINGKRSLKDNTPLNTHLCLSNENVRKAYVKNVCEYAAEHPEVDFLHVWLGDGFSNFCECEKCAAMTPTDWYVKLLNELDAELTRRGSAQKLVFLAYFELLYPPVTQRIEHEDRFALLFCPYGRDFLAPYRKYAPVEYEPARNNTFGWEHMRTDLYLKQLSQWQEIFHGDTLAFDYTLYDRDSFMDMTNLNTAALIADDCVYMRELGVNGRIECGDPTAMSPTSLCYSTMAYGLFEGQVLSVEDFYEDNFGADAPVLDFFRKLQHLIPEEMIRRKRQTLTGEELAAIKNACVELETFRGTLFAYSPDAQVHRTGCQLALNHLQCIEAVYGIMVDIAESRMTEALLEERVMELRKLLCRLALVSPRTVPAIGLCNHLEEFFHFMLTGEYSVDR